MTIFIFSCDLSLRISSHVCVSKPVGGLDDFSDTAGHWEIIPNENYMTVIQQT